MIERSTPPGQIQRPGPPIRVGAPGETRWRPLFGLIAVVATIIAITMVTLIVVLRSSTRFTDDAGPVSRQDFVERVSAKGTVNPIATIDVDTQVSGSISQVNVDTDSRVRKGEVLATLDAAAVTGALDEARAALAQAQDEARAAVARAAAAAATAESATAAQRAIRATAQAARALAGVNATAIADASAAAAKAQTTLAAAQQIVPRDRSPDALGDTDQTRVDADRPNLVTAQSDVAAARIGIILAQLSAAASISVAAASEAQTSAAAFTTAAARAQAAAQAAAAAASADAINIARAEVQTARINLQHAIIAAPVDGTIIARRVSVGQTVTVSPQAPALFSIVPDLKRMEVDLVVGESDIGKVRAGQTVDFHVPAYPGRTFVGKLSQVRINPTISGDSVRYTSVVSVDNADEKLLPGMTAEATIQIPDSSIRIACQNRAPCRAAAPQPR